MGPDQRTARRASHRPLGTHALRGPRRDLGGAAQPLPGRRPDRAPGAPRAGALGHEKAPRGNRAAARRQRKGAGVAHRGARSGGEIRRRIRPHARPQAQDAAPPVARDTQGQHRFRRVCARVACDRRDGLARRISLRRRLAGHGGGSAAHRAGTDPPGAHDHPARRRHRIHRRRRPAFAPLGRDQHRKARVARPG